MSKTVDSTTTAFAWDQSGALPVLLSAGSADYVYGPGGQPIEQIVGGAATCLVADQQGSVRLLTNTAGAVVGTYTYGSYGATLNHTGTSSTALQFDGQYTDEESGMEYLQSRYYDPVTGQFISVDPASALTGWPYGYGGDNPVNSADPSGLLCFSWNCIQTGVLQPVAKVIGVAQTFTDAVAVGAAGVGVVASVIGPEGWPVAVGAFVIAGISAGLSEGLGNAYLLTECAADPSGAECSNAYAMYQATQGFGDGVPEGFKTIDDIGEIIAERLTEWSAESPGDNQPSTVKHYPCN
jgi:RHS repeat-associated protein